MTPSSNLMGTFHYSE